MYAIVVSPAIPVKLSFFISLVTCTARPTTQPVVSDIRHAKQVPLLTIFVAHSTLVLYPGSHPQRPGDKANGTHGKLIVVTFHFKILHNANIACVMKALW